MHLNLTEREPADNYDLVTQSIVPRPIAWVLSENEDGGLNLAPFSYFNIVASSPVIFSLAIGQRRDGSAKDTRRNLAAGRPFVIHLPRLADIDAVNQSAATLAPGQSELAAGQLETTPWPEFSLPRLVGPPVAYGCRLFRAFEFAECGHALLLAEALVAWIDEAVVEGAPAPRPTLPIAKLEPLARLGRTQYSGLGAVEERARPG